MKSETQLKLLPFYFGTIGDTERLEIERRLLEEPDALIDYFDIKREMEDALLLPSSPSPKVWTRLAAKVSSAPKKKVFLISFGFAAAVAALLCVLFLSKPKTLKNFGTQDNGILFEGGEPSAAWVFYEETGDTNMMMKKVLIVAVGLSLAMSYSLSVAPSAFAADDSSPPDWRVTPKDKFVSPEENFNLVMKKLLDHYVDTHVSRDELFRAATAGMLESLNDGKDPWNRLISPTELGEMKIELSGKITGIGIALKYEESQGYARVLQLIPGSAAERSGVKVDDEILAVNDAKFKGKPFRDLVYAIRGEAGEDVTLKILREDKIISLKINREVIPVTLVETKEISPDTELLTVAFFSETTPSLIKEKIEQINQKKIKNVILDLRDNGGGGFNQALESLGMFVPEGTVVARTKDRAGEEETFKAKGSVLNSNVHLTVLVDHGTTCAAELFASTLKETRKATLIGQGTFGKWDVQTVETLPNHFGIKYTVKNFYSSEGKAYSKTGIKPDLEIPLTADTKVGEMRMLSDWHKRLEQDAQLRAAIELTHSS